MNDYRAVAVVVCNQSGERIAGASVKLQTTPTLWFTGITDADGYVEWKMVPSSLTASHLRVSVDGCVDVDTHIDLTAGINQQVWLGGNPDQETALRLPAMQSAHVDPSVFSLDQLAANWRGSMWTARCNVPWGPRPNRDDNILALNYYHLYGADDRAKMLAAYRQRGYTHGVASTPIDAGGYHGMWPSQPGPLTQERWDAFLDSLQERWDAGIASVVFLLPDEYQASKSDWASLEPFFAQERAQRLIRIVVPAWEPLMPSSWWQDVTEWQRRMFPKALWCVHFTPDHDAPGIGGEAENDELWRRIARNVHVFLHQSGEFADGEAGLQSWLKNWNPAVKGSYPSRFNDGYANWPTFSAWGNRGIVAIPAEYGAWWATNENTPEAETNRWGAEAMRVGAPGYLDGGPA